MTGHSNKNSLWFVLGFGTLVIFTLLPLASSLAAQGAATTWTAPASAKDVKNPVPATPKSIAAGKEIYEENCLMCHGEKGTGDGIAAQSLNVKPADFADAKLMKTETDGSLFWKMSNGRGPMPGWKGTLSDTQRWQLVNYIRTFSKGAAK
jgi:mono/diheme cytochrome c family protein